MNFKSLHFKKGMSLIEFHNNYGTEDQCRQALIKLKWPDGFVCRHCKSTKHSYLETRRIFNCNSCSSQESVTAFTIFEDTKLPLLKWFLAIFLFVQSKNGISALEIKRQINVTYFTAWKLKHKLMQVMKEREDDRQLTGNVQIDDAYLGGKHSGKRGRGAEGKTPFIAAVQTDEGGNPKLVKLSVVQDVSADETTEWAKKSLDPQANLTTDGWKSYAELEKKGFKLEQLNMDNPKTNPNSKRFYWVNTILSNVKTSLTSSYKHHDKKYAQRYLSEFEYRFNRRYDLQGIFIRFLFVATLTPPMPYRLLTLPVIGR